MYDSDVNNSVGSILRKHFDSIQGRNPAFSVRAFARKLNVHPSALSLIMLGKRNVSTKLASRLANGLDLSEPERTQILKLAAGNGDLKKLAKQKNLSSRTVVDLDEYFFVTDWYYYAILSLAETREFRYDPSYIVKRLRISLPEAKTALERLQRLGYFKQENGQWVVKPVQLATRHDVLNQLVQRRLAANLEAAQTALQECPVEEREFTSITMAINRQNLPAAKNLIREFRDRLCVFLEEGEKEEVYEFCLSLFPRTDLAKQARAS